MKTSNTAHSIKTNLNALRISDIYSLMLFVLYKVQDIPEYAVLSELCYLLDGSNLTRMLSFFAGKTIKIPTQEEFSVLINALLLYQYIDIEHNTLVDAQARLEDLTPKQQEKVLDLYLRIIPVIQQYNINRA